jgi:hypothetical protein
MVHEPATSAVVNVNYFVVPLIRGMSKFFPLLLRNIYYFSFGLETVSEYTIAASQCTLPINQQACQRHRNNRILVMCEGSCASPSSPYHHHLQIDLLVPPLVLETG